MYINKPIFNLRLSRPQSFVPAPLLLRAKPRHERGFLLPALRGLKQFVLRLHLGLQRHQPTHTHHSLPIALHLARRPPDRLRRSVVNLIG